jgi:hypothetical protein
MAFGLTGMVEQVTFTVWQGRISAITWRSLLSAILIFAVLLGPYSFAGDGHAEEHQSHSSMTHHHEPIKSDQKGLGHAFTHCGSAFCSPSFVAAPTYVVTDATASHPLRFLAGDDAMLRAHYLDGDPPVPRESFSDS